MSKRGHYGLWSEKDLLLAVDAYKNGKYGLNQCSRVYKIPKATIKRHADQKNCLWNNVKVLGRPRIFSKNLEEIISEHIIHLRECSFDLTIADVGKLAFDIAENYHLPHTFNREKKVAGKKWLYPFLKRNPHLSLGKNNRKPKTTLRRLERFFDRLEQIIDKHKFTGATIYHVDKCIFTTLLKTPQEIVARKGKYQLGSISSVERGVNTSVICAVSAAGLYIPPMIIFKKKKKLHPNLERGAPPGSFVTTSKTGNLNSSLFVEWLKHFQAYINCSIDNKVLLLLDGRNIHSKTFHACEFARKNGIVMLQTPSFRIRPLVLGFFGPLLKYFSKAQKEFLHSYKKDKIYQRHISRLVNKAYRKAATPHVAEKGFRLSGIWPYNRHVIKKGKFVPADGAHSSGNSDTFSSDDENSDDNSPQDEDKQYKKLLKEISQRAKKTLYRDSSQNTNEPKSSGSSRSLRSKTKPTSTNT